MDERAGTRIIVLAVFMTGSVIIAFNGMVFLHELGHVAAIVLSGGEVDYIRVSPIDFGFTARAHDPHPLVATWGGPLLGCVFAIMILLPIALYLAAMFAGPAITYSLGISSIIGALLAAAVLGALAGITVHRAPHKCNRLAARSKPPRLHTALIAVAVGVAMIVIELTFLHR